MAIFKNYSIQGVGDDVQLGKGGPRLVVNGTTIEMRAAGGALTTASVATPTAADHVATKNYVDLRFTPSTDANNLLTAGTDSKLLLTPASVISSEVGNALAVGIDDKLSVNVTGAAFVEGVQDVVGAFVVAGTGVTLTYSDAGNSLTVSANIVNNLTGGGTTSALSAQQGVVLAAADTALSGRITTLENAQITVVNNLTAGGTAAALSAQQGVVLAAADTALSGRITAIEAAGNINARLNTIEANGWARSSQANNELTVGSDGKLFYQQVATTLAYNTGTKVLTFTNHKGVATNIDLSGLAVDVALSAGDYDPSTMLLTLTDTNGSTPDVVIDLSQLRDNLVDNGNRTFTYTRGDGLNTFTFSTVTNLSFTRNDSSVTVVSDTGNDAVLPVATTSLAGVLSATDKAKINYIPTFAGGDANKFLMVNETGTAIQLGGPGYLTKGTLTFDLGGSPIGAGQKVLNTFEDVPGVSAGDFVLVSLRSASGTASTANLVADANVDDLGNVNIVVSNESNSAGPSGNIVIDYVVITDNTAAFISGGGGGGGGSSPTNLSVSSTSSTVTVNSSTGTSAVIPAATTANAGVMSTTDKTKLDSMAGADFTEATQDVVAAFLTSGTGIGLFYNDAANSLQVSVSNLASTSLSDSSSILRTTNVINNLTTNNTTAPLSAAQGLALSTSLAGKLNTSDVVNDLTTGGTAKALSAQQGVVIAGRLATLETANTNINETIDDRVDALLIAGTNVTKTYNDASNTLTINAASTNLGLTTTSTTLTVTSSTGSSVILPAATTSVAGVISAADKTKVNMLPSPVGVGDANKYLRVKSDGTGFDLSGPGYLTKGTLTVALGATALAPGQKVTQSFSGVSGVNAGDFVLVSLRSASGTASTAQLVATANVNETGVINVVVSNESNSTGPSGNVIVDYVVITDNTAAFISGGGGGGGGSGTTNLTSATTTTTVDINSSTGTSATIPAATSAAAGVMTAADKAKLDTMPGSDFVEATQDVVGALITAGTGISATYVDASASLTIAVSGLASTSLTDSSSIVRTSNIINNLTSSSTTAPLAAAQGQALNTLISAKLNTADVVNDLTTGGTTKALSAQQGVVIAASLAGKLNTADLVNDLTTGGATKVLSAQQGVVLAGQIAGKIGTADVINDLTTGGTTKALSAQQGVVIAGRLSAVEGQTFSASYTATSATVSSSTGASVALAQATTTNAGLLSAADKTKLNAYAATPTFLSLTDTPSSFVGQGGKFLRVNSGATALEFANSQALPVGTISVVVGSLAPGEKLTATIPQATTAASAGDFVVVSVTLPSALATKNLFASANVDSTGLTTIVLSNENDVTVDYGTVTVNWALMTASASVGFIGSGTIVNDLTTGGAGAALSAEQGKTLQNTKLKAYAAEEVFGTVTLNDGNAKTIVMAGAPIVGAVVCTVAAGCTVSVEYTLNGTTWVAYSGLTGITATTTAPYIGYFHSIRATRTAGSATTSTVAVQASVAI